jgi:hypothetical protein
MPKATPTTNALVALGKGSIAMAISLPLGSLNNFLRTGPEPGVIAITILILAYTTLFILFTSPTEKSAYIEFGYAAIFVISSFFCRELWLTGTVQVQIFAYLFLVILLYINEFREPPRNN